MFDHPYFEKYDFHDIPLNRDLYLIDEMWMNEYERCLLAVFEGANYQAVGYVGFAAARKVGATGAELSWYPNTYTRFHEVPITLPREQFVTCVGSYEYDEKPRIFTKSGWLDHLYLRSNSVFALIDAVGVKGALNSGLLTREKLIRLRDQIDAIAARHPAISFISFADSLLLKSNWQVGSYDSDIKYSYKPEDFIRLVAELQPVYQEFLGLSIYAVLTQGSNMFYEDPLLHISSTRNHISLNSLGLPFAQLLSIECAARAAIRGKVHLPAELYMDEYFFHSLSLIFEFQKASCKRSAYREPLTGRTSMYVLADCDHILRNLRDPEI